MLHGRPCLEASLALTLVVLGSCSRSNATSRADAAFVEEWTIAPAAHEPIGDALGRPTHQFYRAFSPRFVADDVIAVANANQEIRFFHISGRHIRTVGRRGDGPEEFGQLSALVRVGLDSLLAYDTPRNRIVLIDTAGRFGRQERAGVSVDARGGIVALPDGRLAVWRTVVPTHPERGVEQVDVPLVLVHAGRVEREIAILAGPSWLWFNPTTYDGQPLTGVSLMAGWNDRIAVTYPDLPGLRLLHVSGAVERELQLPVPLRHVTENMLHDWEENLRRSLMLGGAVPPVRLWPPGFKPVLPEYLPTFSSLLRDDADCLWLQVYPEPRADETEWLVVDPARATFARMRAPRRIAIADVRQDLLVGLAVDELDVQRIEFLHVIRPPVSVHCRRP